MQFIMLRLTKVPNSDQHKLAYAFVKAIPEEITEENIHSVILTVSVKGSASQNFYNVIDNLYAPLLMKVRYFLYLGV